MRDEIWKRVAVICDWKVFPKKLMSESKRERFEEELAAAGEGKPNEKIAERESESNIPSFYHRMRAVDVVVREFQQLNPTVYRSLIDVLGTLYELLREQACVSEINEFLRAFNRARSDPERFDRAALDAFEATLRKMCTRIRADRPAVCTGELLETYRKRLASQSANDGRGGVRVPEVHKAAPKRTERDRPARGRVRKLSAESGSSQIGLLGAPQTGSRQSQSAASSLQQPSISRRSDPAPTRRDDPGVLEREGEQIALADMGSYKAGAQSSSSGPAPATNPSLDGESLELVVPDTRVRSRKWKQSRTARAATDESDDERRVVMTAFDEDDEEPAEI